MKKVLIFFLLHIPSFVCSSQTTIKMKRQNGVSIVPCKVNGLDLSFIFDTGASDVTISLTEALFMLKNGYLGNKDVIGTAKYSDANGDINEGYTIILRELEFAGFKLLNVKASIVKNIDAPLLLGQSAISKLGTIQIDLQSNTLVILSGKGQYDYSKNTIKAQPSTSSNNNDNRQNVEIQKSHDDRQAEMKEDGCILRTMPDETSEAIYWVPKDSEVVLIQKEKIFVLIKVKEKTGYITLKDYKKFFEKNK